MTFRARKITKELIPQMTLRGLRSFTNVDLLTDLLCEKHQVLQNQRQNVRSQAQSIRACLQQALEYRESAIGADFSKPTLIYYSIMSLALCEILFKRDGNYRLDKLRERHAHHGLEFSMRPEQKYEKINSRDLAARPLGRGTFRVWYETSEERGIYGQVVTVEPSGQRTGVETLASSGINSLPYKFDTVSLQRLAQICPGIFEEARDLGVTTNLTRAGLSLRRDLPRQQIAVTLTAHPSRKELLEKVMGSILFHPRCIDLVQVTEFESGFSVKLSHPLDADYLDFRMPPAFGLDENVILLSVDDIGLNEFAIYYLASYISGMFARYYPEYWAKCSEHHNSLYLLIDAIMNAAILRAPTLLLEEFRREMYVLA